MHMFHAQIIRQNVVPLFVLISRGHMKVINQLKWCANLLAALNKMLFSSDSFVAYMPQGNQPHKKLLIFSNRTLDSNPVTESKANLTFWGTRVLERLFTVHQQPLQKNDACAVGNESFTVLQTLPV